MDDACHPYAVDSADLLSSEWRIGYGVADTRQMSNKALAQFARTMIGRHAARLSSADDLAATLAVDVIRLEQAFTETYGKSVGSWIYRERFRLAQRLLVETSLGLSDIAARIGFGHPSKFVVAFREYVGVSPWSFRHLPYNEQIAAIECSSL